MKLYTRLSKSKRNDVVMSWCSGIRQVLESQVQIRLVDRQVCACYSRRVCIELDFGQPNRIGEPVLGKHNVMTHVFNKTNVCYCPFNKNIKKKTGRSTASTCGALQGLCALQQAHDQPGP